MKIGAKEQALRQQREDNYTIPKDGSLPPFLVRPKDTPEQAAARQKRIDKMTKRPDPSAGLKVIEPVEPMPASIRKALDKEFAEPKKKKGAPSDRLTGDDIAFTLKAPTATPAAQASTEATMSVSAAKKKTTRTPAKKTVTSARKAIKSTAARTSKTGRKMFDWNAAMEAAQKGTVPPAPDFSANTHRYYREPLADCVKLVKAGDVKALAAMKFTRTDGSPGMIQRYRDLALVALKSKKK